MKFKYNLYAILVAVVGTGLLANGAAAQQAKPNILVWGDDIGVSNISADSDGLMGYTTPNIDRLLRAVGTHKAAKSARDRFYYTDDDSELVAFPPQGDYKYVFEEQRSPGTMQVWAEPFTKLRLQKIFQSVPGSLPSHDITSNTFWDWQLNHVQNTVRRDGRDRSVRRGRSKSSRRDRSRRASTRRRSWTTRSATSAHRKLQKVLPLPANAGAAGMPHRPDSQPLRHPRRRCNNESRCLHCRLRLRGVDRDLASFRKRPERPTIRSPPGTTGQQSRRSSTSSSR